MNELIGERVMLREFRQEDISGLRSWVNDPDTTRCVGGVFRIPQTWEQTESCLSNILNGGAGGVNLVIADKTTKRYLGQCAVSMIDQTARHGELSVVIAPDCAGSGYGREGLKLLIAFAFRQLNLNRVWLKVCADNEKAVHCYESCGLVREGLLRSHAWHDGHWVDVIIMGLLREEFESRKP